MTLEKIGFYTLCDARATSVSPTSQMWRCEMIITEACNFHCPYCRGLESWVYGDRRVRQLSLEDIKRNIDLWLPLKNLRFSGGEPTTHPALVESVRYAAQRGVERIAISTNGSAPHDLYAALVDAGCNDFSVSLDACCAAQGDQMAGVSGVWDGVVETIRYVSSLVYTTVGVVFTPDNLDGLVRTVQLAHNLGVADIRIISSAQWNEMPGCLDAIPSDILSAHPILAYRVARFMRGCNVRGIQDADTRKCFLVLDDSVIAGDYHFPCVIYMREGGQPIGHVEPSMRAKRVEWHEGHDTHCDGICSANCLDVCIDHNNAALEAPTRKDGE